MESPDAGSILDADATAPGEDLPDTNFESDVRTDPGDEPDCPEDCGDACPQGCFRAPACEGDDLRLVPSLQTLGASARADDPAFHYRPKGHGRWTRGQPASRRPDDQLGAVAFWLAADTEYEVNLGGQCGSARTLPLDPQPHAGDTVRVSPGDSIQEALGSGAATIHVSPGVYREELHISRSVVLLADDGVVLDGARENQPSWRPESDGIYSTALHTDIAYLRRDGQRLYHYADRASMRAGEPVTEGWWADGARLWVRVDTPAGSSQWQIPSLSVAIHIDGAEDVQVEGFEIRDYGAGEYPKGIDVTGSRRVWLRRNHIHATPSPIWLRRGSAGVRIEGNELHQSGASAWPWTASKGTDHENNAITIHESIGTLVRSNQIHDVFNGIYAGGFGATDPALAAEVDAHDNVLADIGDDAIEPEGPAANARFWRNTIQRSRSGFSFAPVTHGPVYVLRNTVYEALENPFKLHNGSSAPVFLFHNVAWTDRPDQNALSLSDPFSGAVFRNNVLRGRAYAIEQTRGDQGADFDYDCLYTVRGAPVVKWSGQRFDTLEDWCEDTGFGCHAQPLAPGFAAPLRNDFALAPHSPNIDAGVVLNGINDDFSGAAPDLGAIEFESR